MCFKYEEEYEGGCWDYLEFGQGDRNVGDGSLTHILEDEYGAEINAEFISEFLRFLEQMHDRGIIKPKPKEAA